MHLRRWPTLILAACLVLVAIGALHWRKMIVGQSPADPATITLLYTRGLSGRIDSQDAPPKDTSVRTLADVASLADRLRATTSDAQRLALIDVGNSLTGQGTINALHRGTPMAMAMAACGYRAAFPSTRDLLLGSTWLGELAEKGRFTLLVGNSRPPQPASSLVVAAGPLRVAVFGLYLPETDETDEEDTPGPGFSRNLDLFRQVLVATSAEARVVVAHVRNVQSLARRLPEATVIIPAIPCSGRALQAAAPAATLAPAIGSPEVLGRVDLRLGASGKVEVSCSLLPLPRTSHPTSRLARIAAPFRQKSAAFITASSARAPARVLACLDDAQAPSAGCETAPLVAGLVQQETACDACLLAPDDCHQRLPTVLTSKVLDKALDPRASVQVREMTGIALEELLKHSLEGGRAVGTALPGPKRETARPALAGLCAWLGQDGRLLLVQRRGQALRSLPRLRVAISSSLLEHPTEATPGLDPIESGAPMERSLRDVVYEALASRPLLPLPPRTWFTVTQSKVPEAPALIEQGLGLLAAGRPAEAREAWIQALCRRPDEKTSLAALQALQAIDPQAPPSYRDLALLAEAAGWRSEAVRALRMGDTAWPTAWVYPLHLARADLQGRTLMGVEAHLQAARERNAPSADVDLVDGWRLLMGGQRANATRVLQRASQADPRSVQARALAGMALFAQGSAQAAFATWQGLPAAARVAPQPRPGQAPSPSPASTATSQAP